MINSNSDEQCTYTVNGIIIPAIRRVSGVWIENGTILVEPTPEWIKENQPEKEMDNNPSELDLKFTQLNEKISVLTDVLSKKGLITTNEALEVTGVKIASTPPTIVEL